MDSVLDIANTLFGGDVNRMFTNYRTKTYNDFISLIDETLKDIILDIENQKNSYSKLGEDALTSIIIGQLIRAGFDASHDKNIGGHADIVIEKDNFQWLGEAKVHKDYGWLLQGFNQLTTRYSSGKHPNNYGGLIIYNKNKDAKSVIDEWKVHLQQNIPETIIVDNPDDPLSFVSEITHGSSGLPYKVQHYCVLLHHMPKDTKK